MEKFTSKSFKILMIAVVVLLGVLVCGLSALGTSMFSNVFGHGIRTVAHGGDKYHRGPKGVFKFGRRVQRGLKRFTGDLSEENARLPREQHVDYHALKTRMLRIKISSPSKISPSRPAISRGKRRRARPVRRIR